MDHKFLCEFVEVVAANAARGFRHVQIHGVRGRWSKFDVVVTISGRLHRLTLEVDDVIDTLENNSLVSRLEEQLSNVGAVEHE